MELNHFKDMIFEMLNESDNNMIRDIDTNDKANTFGVTLKYSAARLVKLYENIEG